MGTIPICAECRHYRARLLKAPECRHAWAEYPRPIDIVTGKRCRELFSTCHVMRKLDGCGYEGKLWEPKA